MTSDPFARPRKYFTIGILVSGALVALAWCALQVPWRSPNWFSFELSKRTSRMHTLSASAAWYTESHAGEPPESIAELIRATSELSDPDLVRDDELGNRILSRAVLLRGVRVPSGKVCKWLIVVLVPKDRVIKGDMICASGDPEPLWSCSSVEEAEQLYGREVVEAAYRRDREDRARVATQPVKSAE